MALLLTLHIISPLVFLPTLVLSLPLPWNYTGFSRFPSFYFGASADPQSPSQLALVARFALVGWDWQQSFSHGHGEAQGYAAAAALRKVSPAGPPTSPDATFVYRQSESLFTYYDLFLNVTRDPSLLFAASLHDPVTSKSCGGGGLLAYSNSTFTSYWVEKVGGEVATEAPLVNAVFYDGYDKLYAGNTLASQGCPNFNSNATAHELRAKIAATATQAKLLNAAGVVPFISTYNYLKAAAVGVELEGVESASLRAMNGVYEDELVENLRNRSWLRFYEVWLGHGEAQDSAQISNAILEGDAGVPFVARSDPKTMHSLEYGAMGFLIAQASGCYWGASSGWLDPDWPWRGIFDWKVGPPLGNATRINSYTWTRAFQHANVTVNTKVGKSELVFEGDTYYGRRR